MVSESIEGACIVSLLYTRHQIDTCIKVTHNQPGKLQNIKQTMSAPTNYKETVFQERATSFNNRVLYHERILAREQKRDNTTAQRERIIEIVNETRLPVFL